MPPSRPALINLLTRIPQIGGKIRAIHDAWLRRRIDAYWRTDQNLARQLFEKNRPHLNAAQQRVLTDLTQCGIAQAHFDELFDDRRLWDELSPKVDRWSMSDTIREKERRYLEGNYLDAKWKEYIMMMTQDDGVAFSLESPLLQIGLQPVILDIVNSYFGMQAKLFHLDVWKTIPSRCEGPLTGSQRWHRDPEDLKLVKVFLYLSDVDQDAGPLHYIRYSRRGDEYGNFWPQKLPYGRVVPSDELEKKIPRTDWAICTAPAGTFVFVDTTGLHMGGRASKNQRLFATWGFASKGMIWPRCFKLDTPSVPQELTAAARYALSE